MFSEETNMVTMAAIHQLAGTGRRSVFDETFLVANSPKNKLAALTSDGQWHLLDKRCEAWVRAGTMAQGAFVDKKRRISQPTEHDKVWALLDRFDWVELDAHLVGMWVERWHRVRGDLGENILMRFNGQPEHKSTLSLDNDAQLMIPCLRALEAATESYLCVNTGVFARRGTYYASANRAAEPGRVYAGVNVRGDRVVVDSRKPLNVPEGRVHEWFMPRVEKV